MKKYEYPLISVITTCKGRLDYLKRSLPGWLDQDYPCYEVVVVDFDCPQKTADYIEDNRRYLVKKSSGVDLRAVRVLPRPFFNLNEARNVGCLHARGDILFLVDADVQFLKKDLLLRIGKGFAKGKNFFTTVLVLPAFVKESVDYYRYYFDYIDLKSKFLVPFASPEPGLSGTVAVNKQIYNSCGRYDEQINKTGWGWDDIEFYLRYLNNWLLLDQKRAVSNADLLKAFSKIAFFARGSFRAIENSDDERGQFYPVAKNFTAMKNQSFLKETIENLNCQIPLVEERVPLEKISAIRLSASRKNWLYFRIAHGAYLKRAKEVADLYFKKISGSLRLEARSNYFLAELNRNQERDYLNSALRKFRSLSNLDSKDLLYFGLALKKTGCFSEAEKRLTRLFEHSYDQNVLASAAFHLGEIYFQERKFSDAEKYFQIVLKNIPEHQKAFYYLTKIREQR